MSLGVLQANRHWATEIQLCEGKSDVKWSWPGVPCLVQGYELTENTGRMRKIKMSAVHGVKLS